LCRRNLETLIHLLKGSLGTGILAMPNAFFKAGLIVGFVGTILIGSLCTYCIHVLVSSLLLTLQEKVRLLDTISTKVESELQLVYTFLKYVFIHVVYMLIG
jgi:proton-coupled amino acid transporter